MVLGLKVVYFSSFALRLRLHGEYGLGECFCEHSAEGAQTGPIGNLTSMQSFPSPLAAPTPRSSPSPLGLPLTFLLPTESAH